MDEIELVYGGAVLPLCKSAELIGIAAPLQRTDRLRSLAAMHKAGLAGRRRGGFQLLTVDSGKAAMERSLDALRGANSQWKGSHVFHIDGSSDPIVPTGELYLVFDGAVPRRRIESLLKRHGLRIAEARGPSSMVVRTTSASANPIKVAAALQKSGLFRVAEPDFVAAVEAAAIPTDPLIERQWHLRNKGSINGNSMGMTIGADAGVIDAWQRARSTGRPDVTVAVVDDGFDLEHPDLSGPGKIRAPFDAQTGRANPRPVNRSPGENGDWHGTACAALAVGTAGASGVVGVAPGASLMPIRLDPQGVSARMIERCFDHALANGAAIVSCSFQPVGRRYLLGDREKEAIARCAREGRGGLGTLIVFAAGNQNMDINDPGRRTANGWAAHPDVIAVAGSTSKDTRYLESNYGREISVCAPAGGSPGHGITTADVRDTYAAANQTSAGFATGDYNYDFTGTSAAAPIVAGICALMISVRRDVTGPQVREVLQMTANKIGAASSYTDGHSPKFGHGRVNAAAAIEKILRL